MTGAEKATAPVERRPVLFAATPASRLWIALCLGLGGAIFSACLLLALSEVFMSLRRQVLEAIVQGKLS